jgi:hypothetical protein
MPRTANGSNMSIAQLEQLLMGRRAEVRKLEKQRAKMARKLAVMELRIRNLGGSVPGGRGGMRGGTRARNEKSLPDMIEGVLSKTGKPMRVRDIAAAVRSAGYHSNSDQFPSIVNQALIKDKRFAAADRGVYQLKK